MQKIIQRRALVALVMTLGVGCGPDDVAPATGASTTQADTTGTASETGSAGSESGSDDGVDTTTDTGEPESTCGNGMIDAGEECDLGPLNSDNGGCTTDCLMAVCGDGFIYIGTEACDDGNQNNEDDCTTLCEAPGCNDGLLSGMESDVDCGGGCLPCGVGLNCEGPSDCETWGCFEGVCGYTESCAEIDGKIPEAPSGRYWIDVDGGGAGTPFEVYCELERSGGGWTLVLVSSDDGQHTWTYANRAWMGTDTMIVGSLDEINRDFKSRAYNEMVFRDILAVHAPSDIWAEYDDVSMGNTDLGHFVAAIPSPNCDYSLAGNGVEMTDGTLVANVDDAGGLCDVDLYFNLGDHETNLNYCMYLYGWSAATYGLGWSANDSLLCPFNDPSNSSMGPIANCGSCGLDYPDLESPARGFGLPLGLNTGTAELGENYMQIYIR